MNNYDIAKRRAQLCAARDVNNSLPPFSNSRAGSAWSVWYAAEYKDMLEATASEIKHRIELLSK